MKIIIFGIGKIYRENKKYISESDEVIAFLDNNSELWGTQKDGITIYNPIEISKFFYDKVILMSIHAMGMKKQLLELGCDRKKIIRYIEYFKRIQSNQNLNKIQTFSLQKEKSIKGCCLIITTSLGYNGGSIAAVYAALALRQRGYDVQIAAPESNDDFMKEVKEQGIDVILYNNLSHACEEELFWTNNFKFIIVNTLQMICCAISIAKSRKVILWLHETQEVYKLMTYWEEDIRNELTQKMLDIYAVSSIARNNFFNKYCVQSIKLMPYGIPDEYFNYIGCKKDHLVFAIIGLIHERKGQDIFLDAVKKMNFKENFPIFKIIGRNVNDQYGCLIEKKATECVNVQMIGEMSHNEIIQNYQNIDVVVVSSREETMSMVATEAMMMKKVCIISNSSGMADYVKEYMNGLTFPTGNSEKLFEKMMWCVNNSDKLKEIGIRARKTYEENFSMDIFGRHLENVLNI